SLSLHLHRSDHSPPTFYTLSLHDALPIYGPLDGVDHSVLAPSNRSCTRRLVIRCVGRCSFRRRLRALRSSAQCSHMDRSSTACRSEEHTSELQSRENLVCRLLLEKKKSD